MAQQAFVLVGPNAGKSGVWGGYEFKDGVCVVSGQVGEINAAESVLSRFYGAHPELIAKQMIAEGVLHPLQLKAAQAPVDEAEVKDGDGAEPSLLEKVVEALKTLDPADDDHWTSNNLPALDVLGERVGQDVTRAQVNEVAQGFTRAAAKAARSK
jgi:hypothetical protein